MRSRRGGTLLGLAVLASIGCAKGKAVEGQITSFGVGDASASASVTQGDDSGGASTTAGLDTETAEVGGENCGNDVVEAPESCDGDDLAGATCVSQGFSGGALGCTANCTYDTASCSDACGNQMIDAGEDCDGDVGASDCTDAGFAGGTLACATDCTFDTTGCDDAVCGDGVLQAGETCDCGAMGSPCTPAQLGNQACTALPAPSGGNYSGGTLTCTPTACTFNESACTACGNGVIDAGEGCDGNQLAGATCQTQGFDTGALSCSAMCTFNTGGCSDFFCGNGSCDPGEDSCSCPAECPDDPNTCGVPCECGGFGGACYCDQACLDFGDCCPNGPC